MQSGWIFLCGSSEWIRRALQTSMMKSPKSTVLTWQTFRTIATSAGVSEFDAKLLMNHVIPGVNAGYITRHELLENHLRSQTTSNQCCDICSFGSGARRTSASARLARPSTEPARNSGISDEAGRSRRAKGLGSANCLTRNSKLLPTARIGAHRGFRARGTIHAFPPPPSELFIVIRRERKTA